MPGSCTPYHAAPCALDGWFHVGTLLGYTARRRWVDVNAAPLLCLVGPPVLKAVPSAGYFTVVFICPAALEHKLSQTHNQTLCLALSSDPPPNLLGINHVTGTCPLQFACNPGLICLENFSTRVARMVRNVVNSSLAHLEGFKLTFPINPILLAQHLC